MKKSIKQNSQSILRAVSPLSRYRTLCNIGKGSNFEINKKAGSYVIEKIRLSSE